MTQEHPITPPPELIQHWLGNYFGCIVSGELPPSENFLATQAARWGADQELEACCKWLQVWFWQHEDLPKKLRATRRPKPSSLKEQAKFAAAVLRSPDETCSIAELQQHWHTICNALEQLND